MSGDAFAGRTLPEKASRTGGELSAGLKPFSDLSTIELETWEAIRSQNPLLRSPFFSVRFADAVQRARRDVVVGLVQRGDSAIGFLPMHLKGRHAYPVGRFLNDAHSLIIKPGEMVDWFWLLRQLNVSAFDFHAMVGLDATSFPKHTCHESVRSFRCELGNDPGKYLETLGRAHKTIGRQPQKTRKLAREQGMVEFEFDCRSLDLLREAIRWKRQQYRRTNILDLFVPEWTRSLL
ncbi:MAG: GNAT family N-acetyltransferase, partial [Planctomycetota bacterium]